MRSFYFLIPVPWRLQRIYLFQCEALLSLAHKLKVFTGISLLLFLGRTLEARVLVPDSIQTTHLHTNLTESLSGRTPHIISYKSQTNSFLFDNENNWDSKSYSIEVTTDSTDIFDCSNPVSLELGQVFSGNTAENGADNFLLYDNSSFALTGPEIIHVFEWQGGSVEIEMSNLSVDLDLVLLSSCDPDSVITSVGTEDAVETIPSTALPPGTYYVVVDGYVEAEGSYDLLLRQTKSDTIFDCGNPVPLTLDQTYSGDTEFYGENNFSTYESFPFSLSGPEVVHTFDWLGGTVNLELSNMSVDLDLILLEDCDPNSLITFAATPEAPESIPQTELSAGTYYVVVDGFNEAQGTYDLTLSIPTEPDWPVNDETGSSHVMLIEEDDFSVELPGNLMLESGDYLGVFYDDQGLERCAGKAEWEGSNLTIDIYGDDLSTPLVKEGFIEGENFQWRIWRATTQQEYNMVAEYKAPDSLITQEGTYSDNGISQLTVLISDSLTSTNTLPVLAGELLQIFPNPTAGNTILEFELLTESRVEISIYDMLGSRIQAVSDQRLPSGPHMISFSSERLSPGMYHCRMLVDGISHSLPFIVIR